MISFFESGIRFNKSNGLYRGHCMSCLLHQGLSDSGSELRIDGGWGSVEGARHWIMSHITQKHNEDKDSKFMINLEDK